MKKTWRQLWQLLGQYRRVTIITPVLVVAGALAEQIAPLLLSKMIDRGINVGDLGQIWFYAGGLLAATAVSLVLSVWSAILSARASAGLARNLRQALYEQIQKFSFADIDKFSPASLVTRLTSDVNSIQNAFSMIIRMAIRAPAMLTFALVIAFTINWRLAMIFLALIPVIVGGMYLITTKAHPHFKKLFDFYDRLNLVVEENIRGIRVVKTFVTEKREIAKFKKASDDIYREFSAAEKILAFTSPLMEFSMYTATLLISWFGARLIVAGQFSVGELVSLISYSMTVLMSLMMISMMMVMIVMSRASLARVSEVLSEEIDLKNPDRPVKKVPDGSIEFRHVGFSYTGDARHECLSDISFRLESGQTLGILGSTGSGKTSLVQLIPRLYDVTAGEVLVGGVDVRAYDLKTLRDTVAMVLQKNVLFAGTIKQNLRWGNPRATDDQLVAACQLAQAHDFIMSLPKGYDSPVEQGGTNFSGGQKQRLCLARAILKQPRVLILDDATSALDTRTEALIREAWRTALPQTTIIIIAQRVLSVLEADQVLLLHDGRIVGRGQPADLLENNRLYQEIYYSQLREEGD